jgi:hypothetical protein
VQFYKEAIPRLRAVAGVHSAAISEAVPLGGAPESTIIRIPGRPVKAGNDLPIANYTIVSPDFFTTVGTPFEHGRDFLDSDDETGQAATIINHTMASRFWPGEDALGKQVVIPAQQRPMTIVGIVGGSKHSSLDEEPSPEIFVPYTQDAWPSMCLMHVVVRSYTDPESVISGVRTALHSLDPDLPLARITTLSDLTDISPLATE